MARFAKKKDKKTGSTIAKLQMANLVRNGDCELIVDLIFDSITT